jgi:amino acid transporter
MRPATIVRAVALIGMFVAGWSMMVRWGDIGKGPPAQWERQVVGAIVLCFVAVVALAAMGTAGTRRSAIARGVAVVAALGAVGLAFLLRKDAADNQFHHLLAGPGWTWLVAGAGFCLAAAVGALSFRRDEKPAGKPTDKARRRKRKR